MGDGKWKVGNSFGRGNSCEKGGNLFGCAEGGEKEGYIIEDKVGTVSKGEGKIGSLNFYVESVTSLMW